MNSILNIYIQPDEDLKGVTFNLKAQNTTGLVRSHELYRRKTKSPRIAGAFCTAELYL